MTVGLYSPLPPSPTGVADYSATLLAELRKHGNVAIAPETCDLPVYHIGNNELHGAIYLRALGRPGVVVLHDAVLHHFYLGFLSKERYLEEFVFNYGGFARQEGEMLWRDRASSAQDPRFFARPMLRRIAQSALAVVVHNPAAARAVHEHAPATPVAELPHFYRPPGSLSEHGIARFREKIGVPPNGLVFAVFGFLRESKRLIPILKAFQRLHRVRPQVRLLVAGQFVSQDLERGAADLLAQPGLLRLPYLSAPDFDLAIQSVDCCLNLRYPSAGETSGIAILAMGAGKALVATDGEEWARYPDTALMRISANPAESEALFETMAVLSARPDLAHAMGRQAAIHIQRYHSLTTSATEHWDFLCRTFASQN